MPETADQSAGAYPESPLTARLARRGREPLGVIDVRHPEHLGTRGTAWMGQRVEMLDRWKNRYGLAASEVPAEKTPVAAAHPFVMRAALPRAEAARESPAPTQFRVRRPNGARDADPAQGARGETAGPVAHDAPPPLRAPEIAVSHTGDSVTQVLRQRGRDARSPLPASPAAAIPSPPADASVTQPPHGVQAATPPAPLVSSVAPGQPLVIARTPVDAQTPSLVLRRKVSDDPLPTARAVAIPATSGLPVTPSKPLPALPQAIPLVQARTPGPSSSALILPSRTAAKAEAQPPTNPPAVTERPASPVSIAPEIPAVRSVVGGAPIVWRRAGAEGSSRSLSPPVSSAPSMQIMRTPSAASPSQSTVALPSNLSTSSGGADVGHLTERVTRLIARQLTVERERRGMAR